MCGIAGIIRRDKAIPDRGILESMTGMLTHRGPDSSGILVSPGAGLGQRRLEVIDIEGGAQPMTDPAGGCTIVYNGEVYNYRELRRSLEKEGEVFSTRSDTEVVLKAYTGWGPECLDRLNGMFAFAILDPRLGRVFLARDRMGQKPLFYSFTNDYFLFASEPKALLVYPDISREIDYEALESYLLCEYVPSPLSIFKQIRKLEPGSRLVLDTQEWKLEEKKYWKPRFGISRESEHAFTNPESSAKRLIELLDEAVCKRLVSDVPLGVFLSGGLDSSLLTALMCRHRNPSSVDTFSIGFHDRSFDESTYARKTASSLGTNHHERILEPHALMELLPRIAEIMDEPFGDASMVPTYLLSDFARETVKVALGGDGGDELFAGYPTFQAERLARLFYDSRSALVKRGVKRTAALLPVSTRNISLDFKIKQFLKGADHPSTDRHAVWLGSFSPGEIKNILRPEIHRAAANTGVMERIRSGAAEAFSYNRDDLLLSYYYRFYLAEDILVKTDRASMAVGLETRAPFLDPEVVEFASGVPFALKMKGLKTKHILKRAASGLVPDEIINRPKKGFGMPVARWIKNELRPLMVHLLNAERLEKQALFNPQAVEKLKQEHLQGRKDNRKQIWTLMAFQLWWDAHGPERH